MAAAICSRADAVAAAVRDLVIENYAGEWSQTNCGSTGIAIYFPESRNDFLHDPDWEGYLQDNVIYPVQFVQDHRWDNFLHACYERVPH